MAAEFGGRPHHYALGRVPVQGELIHPALFRFDFQCLVALWQERETAAREAARG